MFSTHWVDWALLAAYVAFLVVVWLRPEGRARGTLDYLVAGRRVTLPAFVATLVATWYGGILGVGEYGFRFGISNWLVFGVPYYIGALLFALWFAKRARQTELFTLPDLLERTYGRTPSLIGALAVFVGSAPAAYVLMLGTLYSAMFGLPVVPCIIAAALTSLFYIQRGGLRTVVLTDQVQFGLMFAGFAVLLVTLVARHGGLASLPSRVPVEHFTWHGGNPPSAIFVWYVIALGTLVEPAFWQRAYAARDPGVARNGVLISIGCWAVFDFMTTFCAIYARALLPDLTNPVLAFPELAKLVLPPGLLGLFFLSMIATVMSTIDSYGFIAATTIGRDVMWRLRGERDESRIPFYSNLGLWLAAGFATALAIASRSVIDLWRDLGSITAPAMLAPVGTALLGRWRLGPRATAFAMAAPLVVTTVWVLVHNLSGPGARYPLGLEPIYAGLGTSLLCYLVGHVVRRLTSARMAPRVAMLIGCVLALGGATAARADSPDTLDRVVPLPGIEVSTASPGDRAPQARSIMTRDEIRRRNQGLDTPMQLAHLPGVYAYSDAGNGIGYSYLSIRGFPQRRISVLVNGVPLNDPESHEVYWIDHPDLLASTSRVEVQRGVGSALYGAASMGGSVHLETSPFTIERTLGLRAALGSFDTRRVSAEMGSGELDGGWNLYGRYSRIETAGYRELSDSKLWSFLFAARRTAGHHTLRASVYGGPEQTHLAYLGVPADYLEGRVSGDVERDRRFNPIRFAGERDHFFEPHYELIHTWTPTPRTSFTQTLFYFDGEGYYDEQRFGRSLADYRLAPWSTSDSTLAPRDYYAQDGGGTLVQDSLGRFRVERFDLVRRREVKNRHYGWVPRARIERGRVAVTVGGELRAHDGRHVGSLLSAGGVPGFAPGHTYYDYHPRTLAAGVFARTEWTVNAQLDATFDLAWRHADYAMRGDRFDGIRFDQPYDFAIPRAGVHWRVTPRLDLFASAAHARREPALRDLFDAEGVGSVPLYGTIDISNGVYRDPLVRPERVTDWEAGARWRPGAALELSANLYRMDFEDELVFAGQFNTDLGYSTIGNAARSVHQGVELAAHGAWTTPARPAGRPLALVAAANLSVADHHFDEYREVYGTAPGDTLRYDGNAIGFQPSTTAHAELRAEWAGASVSLAAQHVGRIFVDNTESRAVSIEPCTLLDASAARRFERGGGSWVSVGLQVRNLLDRRYSTSGYLDYDAAGALVPHLIVGATRAWSVELSLGF
ncbi:MAG: TonB-dependent receptor [Candidatus Eisenbacteria bacterium]|uniref:TonB-dependent receptor n=1 Tax=Eiseniibacteriota bacterium TaxID=2212470 RepID=A0A849STC9_UNCEI|nr:TonB-dependent receptor [Candidatus Eisenbacteria bacterium]